MQSPQHGAWPLVSSEHTDTLAIFLALLSANNTDLLCVPQMHLLIPEALYSQEASSRNTLPSVPFS